MTENLRKDHIYLSYCRQRIEERLGWGQAADWSGQEFEELSERILEKTGTRLSVSTLKRLWGRVKYDNVPHINTLNVLAQFAGYDRWQLLKEAYLAQKTTADYPPRKKNVTPKYFRRATSLVMILAGIAFLSFLVTSLINVSEQSSQPITEYPHEFSFDPVTSGLPNSVIFDYDVSEVPGRNYSLQQSWDPNRRVAIDPNQHKVGAVYYYPGYFRAKLVVDDEILTEKDLYIKSNGWLATISQQPVPRYLKEEELVTNGYLGPTEEIFQFQHEPIHEEPRHMRFDYVDDFDALHSDNFVMETAFRNTYEGGNGICKNTRLIIRGTEGVFVFNFSIPGCVGDLYQRFNDKSINNKSADFLPFGTNYEEWQHIRLEVKNRSARLYRNDTLICQTTYEQNAGRIVGISYRFLGTGQINYLKFRNKSNTLIYEESFPQ